MRTSKKDPNCPFCFEPVAHQQETVRCPRCGVVHHLDCWNENGKCSVANCDGWAVWSEEIAQRAVRAPAEVPCVECGRPVRPGQLKCRSCAGWIDRKHWFENCFGPAAISGCVFVGLIALIVRAVLT